MDPVRFGSIALRVEVGVMPDVGRGVPRRAGPDFVEPRIRGHIHGD